ncbi:hypothetical protein [Streptomyces paradoxus]|uniref:hypothetical protein n=1 Tax=Streptomyces paradoxus TaxID=66375 RepID=UPI003816D5B6
MSVPVPQALRDVPSDARYADAVPLGPWDVKVLREEWHGQPSSGSGEFGPPVRWASCQGRGRAVPEGERADRAVRAKG